MNILGTDSFRMALMIALIAIVYSNTLDNGFVWDDIPLIVGNVRVRYLRYIPRHFTSAFFDTPPAPRAYGENRYWRPLVLSSFNLGFQLWGKNPFGYHLINILLHAANACLVFFLLRSLPASRCISYSAALVFALHPLQTNAVSYISGRTDLLAAVFLLASSLFFIRYIRSGGPRLMGGLLASLALSLLSKEAALAAPLLLLLIGGLDRRPSRARLVRAVAASICVVVAYLTLRSLLISPLPAPGPLAPHRFLARLPAVAESFTIYCALFLIPAGLHMERFLSVPPLLDPLALVCLFLLFTFIAAAARSLTGGGTRGVFFLWFFAALLPASNIIPLYPAISETQLFSAEQTLYIPLAGLAAFAALSWSRFEARLGRRTAATLGVVILALFSLLTYGHNEYWKDELTFYTKTLAHYPGSVRMRTNLGLLQVARGDFESGLRLLGSVVKRNPRSARAHLNCGIAFRKAGDYAKARREIERAIDLKPRLAVAHNELGLLEMASGRTDAALTHYRAAVRESPDYVVARINLALALMKSGQVEAAAEALMGALDIDPRSAEARMFMGIALECMGRRGEAAAEYLRVLELHPDFSAARENLERLERQREGAPLP